MRRCLMGVCACALIVLSACGKQEDRPTTATWSTLPPKTSVTAVSTASSVYVTTRPTGTTATLPAESPSNERPAYTHGTTGYAKFESAYIGLGIKLTGDWTFLPRADINALDNNPSDFLTNGSLRGIGIIDRFTEVWAQNGEGAIIKIVLEENASIRPTLEARVAQTATALEGDGELGRVETTLTAVLCAGRMYPGIEAVARQNGETQYMLMLMTDLGDYTATVHIIKGDSSDFERELAMLYAVS